MLESSASTLEDKIQNYLDKLEKLPQIRAQDNHEKKHKALNQRQELPATGEVSSYIEKKQMSRL